MKARDSRSLPPTSSVRSSVPRCSSTGFTTTPALLRPDALSRKTLRPLRRAALSTRGFGSLSVLPAIGKLQFAVRATQKTATATLLAIHPIHGFWTSTLPLHPIRQTGTNELTIKKGGHWPPLRVLSTARAIQICPIPPSTLISTPVMYDASCEAKNATVAATSSGCPNRFIGTFATISLANSSKASFGSPVLPKIGVTIGPGATVLTRMPRPASSTAAVRAKERSAAFVAEYALAPAVPFRSATLVFKMIDAPSFSSGRTFWIVKYAPLILISNCSSYVLSDVSASGANFATPAFTNKTSILPSFCETSANSLSRSASLATSACTANTPFPMAFTASSSVFLLRPEMATLAPSSCKRLAVASPMPLFPPVTTATFPSSLFMSVSLCLPNFQPGPCCGIHAAAPGATTFRYLDDYRSNWLQVSWHSLRKERVLWRQGNDFATLWMDP